MNVLKMSCATLIANGVIFHVNAKKGLRSTSQAVEDPQPFIADCGKRRLELIILIVN